MTLQINKEYVVTNSLDTTVISHEMLKVTATHLFLASNKWDDAIVEVDSTIPQGALKHLHTIVNIVKVRLLCEFDENAMHVLTDLYPELSGKIRRCFLMHGNIKEVLEGCVVE